MLSCFWAPPPCHFWSLLEIHREKSTAVKAAYTHTHTQPHIIYVTAVTESSWFSWRVEKSLLKFLLQSLMLSIRKRTHTHRQRSLKYCGVLRKSFIYALHFWQTDAEVVTAYTGANLRGSPRAAAPSLELPTTSHNFTAFSSSHSPYQKK